MSILNGVCRLMLVAAIATMSLAGCGGGGGAPPADVTGRIFVVTSGSPLTGATVKVGGGSAVTDIDGAFLIRNTSSTATDVTVTATGVQSLTQKIGTLTAGKLNDLGDIFVLNTGDAGGYTANVTAQVVKAEDLGPIAGATVRMNGLSAITDATGHFSLLGLPVGLGTIALPVGLVKAVGFEDKSILIDLPLGASPPVNDLGQIQMALPVGGIPPGPTTIRGKISLTGLTDLSLTKVTLTLKSTGAVIAQVTTQTDGLYGFWVPVGTYTVKAEHVGPPLFSTRTQDVTLSKLDVPQTVNMTLVP